MRKFYFNMSNFITSQNNSVERITTKPTVGDMFCGAGGLSLGAKLAGFQVKWGVDKDARALETYIRNHHTVTPYHQDIFEFMKTIAQPEKSIDVLLAAPPCQGFSGANTRGNIFDMTESNMLAMTIPEAVQILRPKALIFENVRGFVNQAKSKDTCRLFLDNLTSIGYKYETNILKTAHYGVCQTRERVFLLAVPKESKMPSWPPATHFINNNFNLEESTKLILSGIIPTPTVDETFRGLTKDTPNMHHLETKPSHLKRLIPDQIPSTVLCTINPGWQNIHPNLWRYISVRECARLQTFPDDYTFYGDLHSQYRQVGNAVPPILAKAIMEQVKKYDNGHQEEIF